jgi:hypothetical protein
MITIISSKRHAELLKKETAADAITDEALFVAAWKRIPDVDVSAELCDLSIALGNVAASCEPGSLAMAWITRARRHCAQLLLAAA